MFCPNCGNPVEEGSAFCGACGTRIFMPAAQPEPAPAPAPSEKPKKKKKTGLVLAIVLAAVLVLLIGLIVLFLTVLKPLLNYNAAVKLMDAEEWSDAAEAFDDLEDYKDSEARYNYCLGMEYFEAEKYSKAKKAFKKSDYDDAEDMLDACEEALDAEEQSTAASTDSTEAAASTDSTEAPASTDDGDDLNMLDGPGEIAERFDVWFTGYDQNGIFWSSDDYADYALTILNFWEPWCSPCKEEMPYLSRIYEEYAGTVNIIGVYSTDYADYEDACDMLSNGNVSYPVIPYGENSDFDDLQTGYVPTTVFLDSEGNIIGETVVGSRGYDDWVTLIEQYLAQVGY